MHWSLRTSRSTTWKRGRLKSMLGVRVRLSALLEREKTSLHRPVPPRDRLLSFRMCSLLASSARMSHVIRATRIENVSPRRPRLARHSDSKMHVSIPPVECASADLDGTQGPFA